jgi:hypothetical protein
MKNFSRTLENTKNYFKDKPAGIIQTETQSFLKSRRKVNKVSKICGIIISYINNLSSRKGKRRG